MISLKKILPAFFVIAFSVLAGCGKTEGDDPENLFQSFDRKAMLQNIGENILLKDIQQFDAAATSFVNAANSFYDAPGATTLEAIQNSWNTLSDAWADCVPYNFGPMEDKLLQAKIDKWPVSRSGIETAIATATSIDNAYINSRGSSEKGLKALEYLLFNYDEGNGPVLASFTTDGDAELRRAYVKALAENIKQQSSILYNAWSPSGENYLATFVNADGNDVSSSIGKLVNVFAFYTDVVKNLKIGNAIGKMADEMAHPDLVELYESGRSLQSLKANLQSMENVFKGGSGQGFDDLLRHMKAQRNSAALDEALLASWQKIYAATDALEQPLQKAVSTDLVGVDKVYIALKEQLVYIKVDMVNNLGVSLTFSDDDGD